MKKLATNHKNALTLFRNGLIKRFDEGDSIYELMNQITNFSDNAILISWCEASLDLESNIALIALGSLGRRELLPYSDLDLLILYEGSLSNKLQRNIELFLQKLWDSGFELGHQVSTLSNYTQLLDKEISVITALMDKRLLAGSKIIFEALTYACEPHQTWPGNIYFKHKWKEQLKRHQKYNKTAYNLEPNIKNGPGGLRDIQMVEWIGCRNYGFNYITHCLAMELISEHELKVLKASKGFLLTTRFALHLLANKDENRIWFEYQKQLASMLGYKQKNTNDAIKGLMKRLFTITKSVRAINELTLQLFRESIFTPKKLPIKKINEQFQITNRYIDVRTTSTFKHHPEALFSIFLYLNKSPNIKGIRGSTIRLIKKNAYLIDEGFRCAKKNTDLFIMLLRTSTNIFNVLDSMNRHGLLAKYIPEFQGIIGQMQFDLFHIYTVDQHSLFVVNNIMKIYQSDNTALPVVALAKNIKSIELLYIAALLHDIGKGHGGSHSNIGAQIAFDFCKRHHLSEHEANLVSWLVKNHLLLSLTAQRKDIYDNLTLVEFCKVVNTIEKLNYLYILTIADIQATNPTLWNSWKESLFTSLYRGAIQYLKNDGEINQDKMIDNTKNIIIKEMHETKQHDALQIVEALNKYFFLLESSNHLTSHIKAILNYPDNTVITIFEDDKTKGSRVFIYAKKRDDSALITTTIISNFNLNIVEANLLPCRSQFNLSSYLILDIKENRPLSIELKSQLTKKLTESLDSIKTPRLTKSFNPKKLRKVYLKPTTTFITHTKKHKTELILKGTDLKGLLAKLCLVFFKLNITLISAKIVTSGEAVEDSFFLQEKNSDCLTSRTQLALIENINTIYS